ncbi:response regulator [Enterococcus casseliflavus]|uniref:response regulator transcription factor n=1 Tax=Enterococcus casseliflavus TaxID=37734 RepID=UPI0039A5C357
MFTILVVDDNKIERTGIIQILRKEKYPFQIFEAKNGQVALDLFKKEKIDILFTDLKMPKMDGIELITRALQIQPQLLSIIYSAHSDFSYAQNALRLGVVQYLLKPMSLEQFKTVFDEVLKIGLSREVNRLLLTIEKKQVNTEEDHNVSSLLNLSGFKQMKLTHNPDEVNPVKDSIIINREATTIYLENNLELIFSKPTSIQSPITDTYCEVYGQLISHSFMENYLSLKIELEKNLFFNIKSRNLSNRSEHEEFPIIEILNLLYLAVLDYDEDKITYYLKQLKKSALSQRQVTVKDLKQILTDYLKKHFEYTINTLAQPFLNGEDTLSTFEDFEVLVYTANETKKNNTSNNFLVNRIYELIQSNISNSDLSVGWLALILEKTPNYLSAVFKKETGGNINNVIGDIRNSLAQSLLKNSSIKISETSKRCGFEDSSYFIQFFKKKNGVTPLQYRKNGVNNE